VQQTVLFGRFRLSVDIKNRLLVPSEIRKRLNSDRDGQAFFIVTGSNGKLWLYPEKVYEQMAEGVSRSLTPTREQLEFIHSHYSLADKLPWDKAGRILLPGDEMKRTGTGTDVMLIGALNHLEIWNASDWEAHRQSIEARREAISALANNATQGT